MTASEVDDLREVARRVRRRIDGVLDADQGDTDDRGIDVAAMIGYLDTVGARDAAPELLALVRAVVRLSACPWADVLLAPAWASGVPIES